MAVEVGLALSEPCTAVQNTFTVKPIIGSKNYTRIIDVAMILVYPLSVQDACICTLDVKQSRDTVLTTLCM